MEVDIALTKTEQTELERCEAIIEVGLNTFFKVGEALLIIRDNRLYRQEYSNFDDYCRDRWDFSRQRASQFILGSQVYNKVSTIVDTPPANEAQIRALSKAAPDQQATAWRQAQQETGKAQPTAKQLEQIVQSFPKEVKATRPRSSSKPSVQVESQDPDHLYPDPHQLPVACSDNDWRIISRTFSDPAWVGQVLLAAAGLSEGELSEALGIKQEEAGPVAQPWD